MCRKLNWQFLNTKEKKDSGFKIKLRKRLYPTDFVKCLGVRNDKSLN